MDFQIDTQALKPLDFTIPRVSTRLNWTDFWGAVKVRWGFGRDSYLVTPGLYKVGNPTNVSDVFVSANYKLSFDHLRKNLDGLDAWIMVIDTKGVNVWCAAGKGTFGTDNIINSIKSNKLELIVKHRTLIVPQLGAVGVAAHVVQQRSGFRVVYGPVLARDVKAFVSAGYKADMKMREIRFPTGERAKLIPVDFMYGKYKLLMAMALVFVISGLDRTGFIFSNMLSDSQFPLFNILVAYVAGIVITPLLLPWIPFRAFALKGALLAAIATFVLHHVHGVTGLEAPALWAMNLSVASFVAMNFTGSSTYTSLSGVVKEMKWALPLQIGLASVGLILFIINKLI